MLIARRCAGTVLDGGTAFAKSYLQVPVDEIVVSGETATVKGSFTAPTSAIAEKKQGTDRVPSFMGDWRACARTSREEGDQLQSAYA